MSRIYKVEIVSGILHLKCMWIKFVKQLKQQRIMIPLINVQLLVIVLSELMVIVKLEKDVSSGLLAVVILYKNYVNLMQKESYVNGILMMQLINSVLINSVLINHVQQHNFQILLMRIFSNI